MENNLNYEKSLARLEEIVAALDNGGLPLEETLKLFAEGTALIASCSEYLEKAQQKITKLLDSGEEE